MLTVLLVLLFAAPVVQEPRRNPSRSTRSVYSKALVEKKEVPVPEAEPEKQLLPFRTAEVVPAAVEPSPSPAVEAPAEDDDEDEDDEDYEEDIDTDRDDEEEEEESETESDKEFIDDEAV